MESLKNKRIVITGGAGYIGNALLRELQKAEAELYVFDIISPSERRQKVTYHNVSLLEYDLLKKLIKRINPQKVFHLAASLNRTRDYGAIDEILEINLKGTNNLLRSLKDINYTSFIFASTSEVYGNQALTPYKEDMVLQPASPYSLSKAAAELSIQAFSEIYNKPFTILRLFNIYGPNLPESFFIPQLISALRRNEDFNMTKGEQKRDFVFIDDIIDALILASTNKNANNQIFNVCSGESKSLRELALYIQKLISSKASINFGTIPYRENEIWDMIGSNFKIKEAMSFINKIGLSEGLRRLIND
jgi:nucleoside-diphosphate-sugar epimerase